MMDPIRVLAVVANPADLPRFDGARLWREIAEAVEPLRANGSLVVERLEQATEAALRRRLGQGAWQVLHLVVHGQDRAEAHYGTIALQSSDGRARNLTAAYLADLVALFPSVKLVVLQAADDAARGFATVAGALVERGGTVAVAPPLSGAALRIFVSKLYSGLLAGLSAAGLSKEIAAAMGGDVVQILSGGLDAPIIVVRLAETLSADPVSPVGPPVENGWREKLSASARLGCSTSSSVTTGRISPL